MQIEYMYNTNKIVAVIGATGKDWIILPLC